MEMGAALGAQSLGGNYTRLFPDQLPKPTFQRLKMALDAKSLPKGIEGSVSSADVFASIAACLGKYAG